MTGKNFKLQAFASEMYCVVHSRPDPSILEWIYYRLQSADAKFFTPDALPITQPTVNLY